jgi:hypothetical protein
MKLVGQGWYLNPRLLKYEELLPATTQRKQWGVRQQMSFLESKYLDSRSRSFGYGMAFSWLTVV